MHPKLVEIRPVRFVKSSAAAVDYVRIVKGHPFSPKNIVGPLHASGIFLRPTMTHTVVKCLSLISYYFGRRAERSTPVKKKTAGENQAHLQKQLKFNHKMP